MQTEILTNVLIVSRITTLTSIRNSKNEVIGYKAQCNHGATHQYFLSEWGDIAYELAEDWAMNHKCKGDSHEPKAILTNEKKR